jgi:uncharacterized protein
VIHRRRFLGAGLAAAGGIALGAAPRWSTGAAGPGPGSGPYGSLGAPDANGIALPEGFASRVIAVGEETVAGTDYTWHRAPDGGATFADGEGWVYVSNSEVAVVGGASAVRFDADGQVVQAYRILSGTTANCAGGPTPWGTWLSCEEFPLGRVWECDPQREGQGEVRPMLGTFSHEAVTVDPERGQLYLTEDGPSEGDGLYRCTPSSYPDLTEGVLEIAAVADDGSVTWIEVDPLVPMDEQRPSGAAGFDGAEGIWFDADHVYFTTKGDNRVWDLDVAAQHLTVLYDSAELGDAAPLTGVDNLVVSSAGDLYVAEDGGNLELVIITRQGEIAPVLRITGHEGSEITGPAFDPSGTRLYVSSQRGPAGATGGVTYEISGPFRAEVPPSTSTTSTTASTTTSVPPSGESGDDSSIAPIAVGVGGGLLAVAGVAWIIQRRRGDTS